MSDSEKSTAKEVKERIRMIITAIDSLKGRKARPDETKICNFVERRFGLKKEEIVDAIKEAVTSGSVLKVKYKDSVSYRNPLKFSSKMSNHVMSISSDTCITPQNMKNVLKELRRLSRSVTEGVPKQEIVRSLRSNGLSVDYDEALVDNVLSRAIQSGTAEQLPNGKYILSDSKRIIGRKGIANKSVNSSEPIANETNADPSEADNGDNGDLDLHEDLSRLSNSTTESTNLSKKSSTVMTRERPISKRKKFKKSLGPDFIESSELGPQFMKDSFEPKCDLCQLRSKSNKKGDKEELLSCKDCSIKVHPSCMDYSEELAERSGRSPWQCMDCKTCDICHDSKDGANMLVCDLCDKGFHMNCHIPTVAYKPIGSPQICPPICFNDLSLGKWVCGQCSPTAEDLKSDQNPNEMIQKSEPNIEENETNEESVEEMSTNPTEVETLTTKHNSDSSSNSSFAFNSLNSKENNYTEEVPNPQNWSPEDVESYIRSLGFPEQSLLFKEQEIDGSSLLLLRRSDVLTGFHMKLGPALKIYSHIVRLQKND